jgi:hypothetical protein
VAILSDGLSEASMPRSNGTIVFDAPWQGRALAIAVLVLERIGRPWEDFRRHLIRAIGEEPERPYWDSWVLALEWFTTEVGLLPSVQAER